ncbi:unnamed protein product [Phytophthora fragariaefolia]|uniref:Unnamed protein product n=1 Tax=Phytophthora fragariaefolia TaxID=1490495 RepID=A0A9W6Y8F3_9STRA|nr:unnamed protein product [Phytophthora fragariaefolia]
MAFVKCEQVEFDYVKRCIEQDATGKCFVPVLDMFGMYLALNAGKKGKTLARNTAMQYLRQCKIWLFELFPVQRHIVEAKLLSMGKTLDNFCMKRDGKVVNKAPPCSKSDLKKMMSYLYKNASSSSDYQDAALLCLLGYLFVWWSVVFAFTLPGTGYILARPTLRQDNEYPKIEVNPDAEIAWPGVCQLSFQPTARGSGKQGKEYPPQGNPRPRSTSAYESRSKEPKIDDSTKHRRSDEFGQGNEASTNIGSPTTPLNQDRSAERQSFGRSSTDGTEEGPVMDLEDKPRPPPQVPSGTPAGRDENLDPPDESPPAQAGTNTSIQPRSGRSTAKKKTAKSKPSRKKINAPDSKIEDLGDLMSDDQLTKAYYKKELHTFLINDVVMRVLRPKLLGELQGPVSPPAAGSTKLSATKALMRLLKETGIIAESFEAEALFDLKLSEIKQSVQSLFELLAPLVGEPDQAQKQSIQSKSTRSTLTVARSTPIVAPGDQTAASHLIHASKSCETDRRTNDYKPKRYPEGNGELESTSAGEAGIIFQAAMERFLKEQQVPQTRRKPRSTGDQDVEMESVGSPDQPTTAWEYDPDDLDLGRPARATVATTTVTTSNQAITPPTDPSVSYVRTEGARRQRKRSDESPLEYLHRLNVAGLRTRLQIKDGPQEVRREHVEHFIETLDDRDLADQLALLRIPDADILEEVLRSRQRAKSRQSKTVFGSIKPRQKSPAAAAGTRVVRAVHVPEDSSDSDDESRSSSDEDLRRVYLASRSPQDKPQDQRIRDQTQEPHHQDRHFSQYPRQTDEGTPSKRCSHCGSWKHDDLGCWRRLTCDKCGKRGHPSDRCLAVCRTCGEIHEAGKCPMEEFYNLIRQWYNPTKHGGMLPESAEKILN